MLHLIPFMVPGRLAIERGDRVEPPSLDGPLGPPFGERKEASCPA